MTRFLITTALEETWRDEQPVLFLGEWCRKHSRKTRWAAMNAEVLPYHWDDRAKLREDYGYLTDFYERVLKDLAVRLNEIHGVDHSTRYWRIVLGPWLGYFIQILFDRWTCIHQAVTGYHLSETVVLTGLEKASVPHDAADFFRVLAEDEWNHHIFAMILRSVPEVTCVPLAAVRVPRPVRPTASDSRAKGLRSLGKWYAGAAALLSRERDAFLLDTSLPLLDEMRMHTRLGQVPQRWRPVAPPDVPVDASQRQWAVPGTSRSEFEACARTLIPMQLPAVYLEGHRRLSQEIETLPWPRRPAAIWTSNSHHGDDVFKVWAAEKVEQGTPLVVSQHGGHQGVGQWSFNGEHEVAISDRYLSWGWTDPQRPQVTPVGQLLSKRPLGVQHASQKRALLVTTTVPRYSYWMHSAMVARQWLDYFEDQCTFVEHLSPTVRTALTVRLYSQDYGWEQRSRWRERFADAHLDASSGMDDLIRETRLYISTYNATTYLESFAMDVPTVMYWNPSHWELRESAVPYFEDLKRVGVFHDTAAGAARHASAIWGDVDAWWGSRTVREAVSRFNGHYCTVPDDLLGRVEANLRDVIRGAHITQHT